MLWGADKWVFPPRPSGAVPRGDYGDFVGWCGQLKFNDTRCLVKFLKCGRIELWSRHKSLISGFVPSGALLGDLECIRDIVGVDSVIDGGLLHFKHAAVKNTLVFWDLLVVGGDYLVGSTYGFRYDMLCSLLGGGGSFCFGGVDVGIRFSDNVLLSRSSFDFGGLWDCVDWVNVGFSSPLLEGIVLKNELGVLEPGFRVENNGSWQCRSRVSTGRHVF